MNELRTYKLKDLGFLGRGKSRHRPRNDASLFGGKYPFIQTGEVKAAELYINSFDATYNEKGLEQSKLWDPETLLITIAANIAETAILDIKACFPDSIIGFIPDEDKADVRFIKYYIDTIKLRMQNISKGTTQDNLSLEKLRSIDFKIPPVETQQKIASILSAFDDLIENNSRRIVILEEMARLIYREWFVYYRYPGHENDRLVDSGTELGDVPEGWEIKELQEVANIDRGKSYRSKNLLEEGGLPFVNLKCFERGGGFRKSGLKNFKGDFKDKHKVAKGDIVIAVTDMTQDRAIIARAAMVPDLGQEYGVMSMDVVKLVPETIDSFFLYAQLRHSSFPEVVKNYANGANVLHLSPKKMIDYPFLIPNDKVINNFSDIQSILFHKKDLLERKNEKLKETRDLLLPKLIAGKVDVNEIKIN